MTRIERRVLGRTLGLGLALTLLVIAADWVGLLNPLERYLYDVRARRFQYFTPQPTDKIVHLDIDDLTLAKVGWWPWPRTKLAELVDEIHLAGAKVIGFDVVFPEPQETRYEKQPDGSFKEIADDQNFANAVRRAGNVLIPVSVEVGNDAGPTTRASEELIQRLQSFARPMPPGLPPMLKAHSELPTILPLAQAARYSGAVNFHPEPDSRVRSIPLYFDYRGKLMPHMALAAFCAANDVNINDVVVTSETITIPRRDGPPIVVPLRTIDSHAFGTVGMFMDIPWFGKPGEKSWETMFDWPNHATIKQHEPLRNVWAIRQAVHEIERNGYQLNDVLRDANQVLLSEKIGDYLANPTDSARTEVVKSALKEMEGMGIAALERNKPADLKEDEAKFLISYRALKTVNELHETRAAMREKLNGKYVLIGWTATGKTDFHTTSIDPLAPGVTLQGVVFNALSTGQFWRRAPWWVGALITLMLGALTTVAVAMLSSGGAIACTLATLAIYLAINGLLFFDYGNRIVPAAAPVGVSMLICFGVTVARFIYERRERARITRRFSSYADPAVVNYYLENPDAINLEGQMKEMTVVFTDLAGFTTISEKLRERTVPLLNEYMSLMLPLIRENKGTWDKFLGDGIMFFFNAPADNARHARDAVFTVLVMQQALEPFNQRLFERGLPKVTMRAGIVTGMMIVGDAGSTADKHPAADYTVLGDEVNLCSRLESANKAVGTRVLIGQRTAELVGDEFLLRPVGLLQVVGKTEGVLTYEVICPVHDATDKQKSLVTLSGQLVEYFRDTKFAECIEIAQRIENEFGSTKFTQLYLRLARRYIEEPPDSGFDGQIVLDEK